MTDFKRVKLLAKWIDANSPAKAAVKLKEKHSGTVTNWVKRKRIPANKVGLVNMLLGIVEGSK